MPEDQDPRETQEWLEALDSVVEFDGVERAAYLLQQLHDEARRHAVPVPFTANTPYVNTIAVDKQPAHPVTWRSNTPSARSTAGTRWRRS